MHCPKHISEQMLLLEAQKGLSIEPRPFHALAMKTGMTEETVISQIRSWFDEGLARRLGCIFDARRLGYKSTLCALHSEVDKIDEMASEIISHPGVTHCYHRGRPQGAQGDLYAGDGLLNLWFALAVPAENFDRELSALQLVCKPFELVSLPAMKRFKIDVVFDPETLARDESFPGAEPAAANSSSASTLSVFSEKEKKLIGYLNNSIPITPAPFCVIAKETGYDTDELIQLLVTWQKEGILRRFALVLFDQQSECKANAMCVWRVEVEGVIEAGRRLAAIPAVTHCYQRPVHALFPYNLFALIHSDSWENTAILFRHIAKKTGLQKGKMLCSLTEYKKASMQYF